MGKGLHLYKMTCWSDNSGKWHCNDVSNLSGKSAKWYTPMRILELSVEDYISLLITKFHAEGFHYHPAAEYLGFHFIKEIDAKAFCSYVNKVACVKNYNCQ